MAQAALEAARQLPASVERSEALKKAGQLRYEADKKRNERSGRADTTGAEPARVLFINNARTELIQVQRDRFLHNWRKVGNETTHPRFDQMTRRGRLGHENPYALIERALNEKIGTPGECETEGSRLSWLRAR